MWGLVGGHAGHGEAEGGAKSASRVWLQGYQWLPGSPRREHGFAGEGEADLEAAGLQVKVVCRALCQAPRFLQGQSPAAISSWVSLAPVSAARVGPTLSRCWLNDPGGSVQQELRRGTGAAGDRQCAWIILELRKSTSSKLPTPSPPPRALVNTENGGPGRGSALRGKADGKQQRGPWREVRVEERGGQRCLIKGGQGGPGFGVWSAVGALGPACI